jgi:hypothetical protein
MFSDRLNNNEYGPDIQEYWTYPQVDYYNLKITLKEGRIKIGELNFHQLTVDCIRKNKDKIVSLLLPQYLV